MSGDKKQDALDKREEKWTLLNCGLADVNTLVKFAAGKDAVDTALTQSNECFEEYKIAHMGYFELVKDTSDADKVKSQYSDAEAKVDKVRTEAGRYLFTIDKQNESSTTTPAKGQLPSNSTPQINAGGEDKEKVSPEDSASQIGSQVSGTSSVLRAKAAAKRAALQARMKKMEEQHQLVQEEQRLRMKRERLELGIELDAATAEEEAVQVVLEDGNGNGQAGEAGSVKDFTGDNPPMNARQQSDICNQQRELIHLLQAPKLDIPSFNGDPIKYFVFMRAFEANVENKISDNSARLTQLINHCTGPALTVVQGCATFMDPNEGYNTAKKLIANRFGNPLIIAQAWIDYVASQDQIKNDDGPAILAYSDLLRTCLHTLKAMKALDEISAQTTLLEIIGKLPYSMASRWRKHVVHVRHTKSRLPKFEDVVTFVETIAEELNVPIYGTMGKSKKGETHKDDKRNKPNRSASYSTGAGDSSNYSKKCALCEASHMLWECQRFKTMTPDERFKFVKSKHICFNCLIGSNHGSRDCRSRRRCMVNKCGKKHSYLLHNANASQPIPEEAPVGDSPQSATSSYADSSCFVGAAEEKIVALPIVAVKVHSPFGHKTVDCFALLDNGSSHSFCCQSLIEDLGITGKDDTLSLTTLERKNSVTKTQVVSNLEVSDVTGLNFIKLPHVYTRPSIPINPENMASEVDVSGFPHLSGVNLPAVTSKEVKLLIGQNVPEALIPLNIIGGKAGEPWACQSLLGWHLNGPISKVKVASSNKATVNFLSVNKNTEQLTAQVQKFWEIDSAGLYEDKLDFSVSDKRVMKMWNDTTIQRADGHYQMDIPFKDSDVQLPNNKPMAESRLASLQRKLDKNSELKEQYVSAIDDLLEKGYAIEVPMKDIDRRDGMVWFLPHHAVINLNKPKIRVVFDAAAKYRQCSLNSMVNQGPDMISKLLGVVLRSRLRPVCIMADIAAMFHQVTVNPAHQDVLRFLWRPGADGMKNFKEYRLTRHVFGGTWSPAASCYALHRTAEDHGHSYSKKTLTALKRDMYVDDLISSTETIDEAKILQVELKELLKKGGFDLMKWTSNEPEVLAHLPASEKSKSQQQEFDSEMIERALGVYWNVAEDTLGYNVKISAKPATKRGALSTLSSVYDPIGLLSPFILKARLIVQELFRLKMDWDEPMPEIQRRLWSEWVADLPNVDKFKVPRCVRPKGFGTVVKNDLHHFSDSSENAYGACSYLRQQDEQGRVNVTLIMAKSRLAPLKKLTIPRLELIGATLAVKQNNLLQEELDIKIDETHYWTDSMIVLGYIANEEKRFHTFVANRLEIIRDASKPSQWHHVEGKSNPADYSSRILSANDLSNKLWINGPEFLSCPQSEWPQAPEADLDLADDDPEVKKEARVFATDTNVSSPTDKLMLHFSSWHKLKASVAWMLVLRAYLIGEEEKGSVKYLNILHMKRAENAIFRYIQMTAFKDEIEDIEKRREIRASSPLVKLQPVMINGLLCVGGRLKNAPHLSQEMKNPIILPKKSHIVDMLVRDIHAKYGHAGREYTLAETRKMYWIIGGRGVVRRVLRNCITCKKREPIPCTQQMADLPADRVSKGTFQKIGVDMFGNFLVKRGRGQAKRYGCIFTCMATRAIHIEVAHTLSTDSFIQCLQRFIARRGKPSLIRSDNGTNFIGADRDLQRELEAWNEKSLHDFLNKEGIQWKFHPPRASNFSGATERMIRSVRRVIAGICNEQILTEEALPTLMAMAESIVNNRPITPNSDDPKDLNALTPSHFLLLKPVEDIPGCFDHDSLRKHWKHLQYLSGVLWKRWLREYLPQLQERTKWLLKSRDMQVGDLILILDTSLPKNEWKLGRILEVFKSDDGHIRSCKVKTKNSVLVRPINKICLLEASDRVIDKSTGPAFDSEE